MLFLFFPYLILVIINFSHIGELLSYIDTTGPRMVRIAYVKVNEGIRMRGNYEN